MCQKRAKKVKIGPEIVKIWSMCITINRNLVVWRPQADEAKPNTRQKQQQPEKMKSKACINAEEKRLYSEIVDV